MQKSTITRLIVSLMNSIENETDLNILKEVREILNKEKKEKEENGDHRP